MLPALILSLARSLFLQGKVDDAPARYDPCQEQCFTSPKCCPSVLTALDPDECVDPPRAPESDYDFYNMCDEMGGFFGGLDSVCCIPEPLEFYDQVVCTRVL